jgi:hypothetical protein
MAGQHLKIPQERETVRQRAYERSLFGPGNLRDSAFSMKQGENFVLRNVELSPIER